VHHLVALPGELLERRAVQGRMGLAQHGTELKQVVNVAGVLPGEQVGHPRGRRRFGESADGGGEVAVTGGARGLGPGVARGDELLARQRVELVGDGLDVHSAMMLRVRGSRLADPPPDARASHPAARPIASRKM
jgi:hypothetical protein